MRGSRLHDSLLMPHASCLGHPQPGDPRQAADALRLLLALVILVGLFRYLHLLAKLLLEAPFIDFAHYYTYTLLVRMGLDPFDPQAVARVDELLRIRRAGSAANYPPLFYLLMQPWVLLPFRPAALAWFLAGQASLAGALAICWRRFPAASLIRLAAVLFVVLNYQPVIESIALGQANLLLLFLVTLAWWGLRAGRSWVVAGAVAAAPLVKPQYGLLVALLFWMGQGRAAWRALLLAFLGLGAGVAVLGLEHHRHYLTYVLSPPEYLYSWTANLSLLGTLHRLFGTSSGGAALAKGLTLAADAVLVVLFARAVRRPVPPDSSQADWAWALGVTAVPLLSPLLEEHHLVVLLLPLAMLVLAEPEAPMRTGDAVLLVGSILLLASRYSLEQFPAFHQGPLSLLATGKLLGVAGLAWALMRRLRCPRENAP